MRKEYQLLWMRETEMAGTCSLMVGFRAEFERKKRKKEQALSPRSMESQGLPLALFTFLVLANIGGAGSEIPRRRGFVGLEELQEFGRNL
jgi:hypothetical protein